MTTAGLAVVVFACILLAMIARRKEVKHSVKGKTGRHILPHTSLRHQYDGWFTNTNKCKDCGSIGCDINLHVSKPCPVCSGTVEVDKPRIWNNQSQKWCTRKEVQDDINYIKSH